MTVSWRDRIATLLVGTATMIYALWLSGPLAGLTAATVALLVLGLGVVASMAAVVPGFAALLAGSKTYLAVASGAGLMAFVSGLLTILHATELTLAVLVVATIVLWASATVRHGMHRVGVTA